MDHKTAAEPNGSSGERGVNTILVTMRYRSGVTYAHRLSDGANRVFDITGIQDVEERKHKLLITVVESTSSNG
jgi:head-tail adaptor